MKIKYISAVEITSRHVKWIKASPLKNYFRLLNLEIVDIPEGTDQAVSQALKQINIAPAIKADYFIINIPRRLVTLRYLTLPSHNEEEIKKMVDLQIVSKIPFTREDVFLDNVILEKTLAGFSKVLVVVVHKDVVGRYIKMFESFGLSPNQIGLSSEGIVCWYSDRLRRLKQKSVESFLVIDIDLENSELCFGQHDKLIFSRNIDLGARDLKSEGLAAFIKQIELTIRSYNKENIGPDPKKIVIVSDLPEASGLIEPIKSQFKVDVSIENALEEVARSKDVKLQSKVDLKGVSLAANFGYLAQHRRLINLLPPEWRKEKDNKKRLRALSRLAVLFALTVLLGILAFRLNQLKGSAILKQLQAELSQTKRQTEKAEMLMRRYQFFQQHFKERMVLADVMADLYALTPPEISFTNFEIDDKGLISVQGMSDVAASVNNFQSNLLSSQHYQDVNLQYATKRKSVQGEQTHFQINFRLIRK